MKLSLLPKETTTRDLVALTLVVLPRMPVAGPKAITLHNALLEVLGEIDVAPTTAEAIMAEYNRRRHPRRAPKP